MDLSILDADDWKVIRDTINYSNDFKALQKSLDKIGIDIIDEDDRGCHRHICNALYWENKADELGMKCATAQVSRRQQEIYTQSLFDENERLKKVIDSALYDLETNHEANAMKSLSEAIRKQE